MGVGGSEVEGVGVQRAMGVQRCLGGEAPYKNWGDCCLGEVGGASLGPAPSTSFPYSAVRSCLLPRSPVPPSPLLPLRHP